MDTEDVQVDENRLYPFPWFYDLFRDTGSMVSEQRSLVE